MQKTMVTRTRLGGVVLGVLAFVGAGQRGAAQPASPATRQTPPLLFDLAADPGERFNIAAAYPDIVAELVKVADAHRITVVPARPRFDELLPERQR